MDYGKQLRETVLELCDGDDALEDAVELLIKAFAQQRYDAGWKDASQHTRRFYDDDLTTPPRVALP